MDLYVPVWEIPVRLFLALIFGGILGWEREWRGHAAGLRTHMLVSLGAACAALVAHEMIETIRADGGAENLDPLRLMQGVLAGIGFIGAGAIIQSGGQIKGLTTAAGLWIATILGLTVGIGHYLISTLVAIFSIFVLVAMRVFEQYVFKSDPSDQKIEKK